MIPNFQLLKDTHALGKVPLPGYVVQNVEDFGVGAKPYTFKVTHSNSRTYVFAASSKVEILHSTNQSKIIKNFFFIGWFRSMDKWNDEGILNGKSK